MPAKTVDWFFDVISPFAYLQLEQFDTLQADNDIVIRPRPVVLGAILNHWGQKGPAEISAKRVFTYRYALFRAQQLGIPFRMPPAHPFNPIHALRLVVALDNDRTAIHALFDFIWAQGRDVNDPDEWRALTERLGVSDADERTAAPAVKAALRENTEKAVERGVFGVPTLAIDGQLFWGVDGTDMALDYLADPTMFDAGEMARFDTLPAAAERKKRG